MPLLLVPQLFGTNSRFGTRRDEIGCEGCTYGPDGVDDGTSLQETSTPQPPILPEFASITLWHSLLLRQGTSTNDAVVGASSNNAAVVNGIISTMK